jgi:dihydrofolate reductase
VGRHAPSGATPEGRDSYFARVEFGRVDGEPAPVAKLIYATLASLDGYVEDQQGKFDWAAPDRELSVYINEIERSFGTHVYGRRMYETMVYWETEGSGPEDPPESHDYASIWRALEKIVYSRTLAGPSSARTKVERELTADALRRLKETSNSDIAIAGAELAGLAFRWGLIDEFHLFLTPILVGGGKRALPEGLRARLELQHERRFGSGAVHLHYRIPS